LTGRSTSRPWRTSLSDRRPAASCGPCCANANPDPRTGDSALDVVTRDRLFRVIAAWPPMGGRDLSVPNGWRYRGVGDRIHLMRSAGDRSQLSRGAWTPRSVRPDDRRAGLVTVGRPRKRGSGDTRGAPSAERARHAAAPEAGPIDLEVHAAESARGWRGSRVTGQKTSFLEGPMGRDTSSGRGRPSHAQP